MSELHGHEVRRYRIKAGDPAPQHLGSHAVDDDILLQEPGLRIRTAMLDHRTPVLAFALEANIEIEVRKERLAAFGLSAGPWLKDHKDCIVAGNRGRELTLPNGIKQPAGVLADELVLIRPGEKLAYATDLGDTAENRVRLIALAQGAHTFFCEAPFCEADAEQAARTGRLTARACGEIAAAAGVERFAPFIVHTCYQNEADRVYAEVKATCQNGSSKSFLDCSLHGFLPAVQNKTTGRLRAYHFVSTGQSKYFSG